MVLVSQQQHPRSLDFDNQRKAYLLRKNDELAFHKIATQVVNLKGEPSTADCVRRVCNRFSIKKAVSLYKYHRCGMKPTKLTKAIKTWLAKRLLALRKNSICTSMTLQKKLLQEKNVKVSDSAIRKVLKEKGYRWLPRAQKRKYSTEDMELRLAFVNKVKRMGFKKLKKMLVAMDGVVIPKAPTDPTERENHCKHGETHMYRMKDEAAVPELAGEDPFAKQIPMSRALPMWGAISSAGVAEILMHRTKKCSVDEWVHNVRHGIMMPALKHLRPEKQTRPWVILCDNEHFLTAKESLKAYKAKGIELWQIPPRSPDLNPIEKFWGWLKRELRRRDLKD